MQNEFNAALDLSEARASLLSGDVVELTNATSSEPSTMKLVWEVSRVNKFLMHLLSVKHAPLSNNSIVITLMCTL